MKQTIRDLRESRFLTQLELAEKLGVRPETVSMWERGVSRPRGRYVRQLAEIFDVSPMEIEIPEGKAAAWLCQAAEG